MRKFLLIISFFIPLLLLNAQETIRVMQYNLTYYGGTTSFCTTTNNNALYKDGYLKIIIDSVLPDVFGVNELMITYQGGDNIVANRLLNNVMNKNRSNYARVQHTGTSNICNMLYYNTNKLAFHKQSYINKDLNNGDIIREIDFYTLYYKDANLATHKDTIFMTFVVAHLKAGSSDSDKIEREKATKAVMKYINDNNIGKNVFFMGDLNLYSDLEGAFQNLTNYSNASINFYDPVNQLGEWHEGSAFRNYHTQSTRTVDDGCHAIGGMDDRFDFILFNKNVRDNLNGVKYKTGTYKALGQDGSATNNSSPLKIEGNTAVSSTIAQALFDMSDHLPVMLELEITQGSVSIKEKEIISTIDLNNPFTDKLKINIATRAFVDQVSYEIINLMGQLVYSEIKNVTNTSFYTEINTAFLPQGLYVLNIKNNFTKEVLATKKVIKQ